MFRELKGKKEAAPILTFLLRESPNSESNKPVEKQHFKFVKLN
jgi:hypothetical protein